MRKATAFSREQYLGQDLVMSEPDATFLEAGGLSAFLDAGGKDWAAHHLLCYTTIYPTAQAQNLDSSFTHPFLNHQSA